MKTKHLLSKLMEVRFYFRESSHSLYHIKHKLHVHINQCVSNAHIPHGMLIVHPSMLTIKSNF